MLFNHFLRKNSKLNIILFYLRICTVSMNRWQQSLRSIISRSWRRICQVLTFAEKALSFDWFRSRFLAHCLYLFFYLFLRFNHIILSNCWQFFMLGPLENLINERIFSICFIFGKSGRWVFLCPGQIEIVSARPREACSLSNLHVEIALFSRELGFIYLYWLSFCLLQLSFLHLLNRIQVFVR